MAFQVVIAVTVTAALNIGGHLVTWWGIPRETGIPLLTNVLVGLTVVLAMRRLDRLARTRVPAVVPGWFRPLWVRIPVLLGAFVVCLSPVIAGPIAADVAGWTQSSGRTAGILASCVTCAVTYVFLMPIVAAQVVQQQAARHGGR